MGLFGPSKIKKLESEIQELKKLTATERGLQNINLATLSANFNRNQAVYPQNNIDDIGHRYVTTDDIYSIVKSLSEMEARIPIYPYLVVDEKAARHLRRIKRIHLNQFERKYYMTKALDDLPDVDPVAILLEDPCEYQSKFEFYVSIFSFLNLFGEAFILKERPSEGRNAGLTVSMHVLFPQYVILRVSDTLPRRVTGYDYKINGQMIYENLPVEDIMHLKYFNPEMTTGGNELRGLSPIKVLAKRLTAQDGITDVTTAQMQNGGVETIVYDKSVDQQAAVEVIGQRKDNFYKFLKNPGNAGAPYFASGEMGAIQLGSSMRDLKAIEISNVTFKKFCNAYGISDILFNSDVAATESNVQEMEKRAYTNTILPNIHRLVDMFKMELLTEFQYGRTFEQMNEEGILETATIKGDGKPRDLQPDISEIPSLQEDMLKMAQWMAISPHITYNEKREMMKFEKLPNVLFDEPLLPSGLMTPEDLVAVPPIDNTPSPGNLGNGL